MCSISAATPTRGAGKGLIDDPRIAELYLGAAAPADNEGPSEMKAVVFDAHGPLDNMRYRDAPDPNPGPKDCVIRVRAVALNGFDPMILRGIPGLKTPLPMTPGADIAGEIVALGAEVDRAQWKIGDRVTVIPNQDHGMVGETLRRRRERIFRDRARAISCRCPTRCASSTRRACPSLTAPRCA